MMKTLLDPNVNEFTDALEEFTDSSHAFTLTGRLWPLMTKDKIWGDPNESGIFESRGVAVSWVNREGMFTVEVWGVGAMVLV
jgi:hypothetical protein